MEISKEMQLEADVMRQVEQNPEFVFTLLHAAVQGLENYRKEITKKNSQIDLIVRNLKPEYYAELKKYVVPEVFENLGLQDAIKVVESNDK